jgi:hypothetical protein
LDATAEKLRATTARPALAAIADDPAAAFTSADDLTKRAIAAELLASITVPVGSDGRLALAWADWLPAGLPEQVTVPDSPMLPDSDQRRATVAGLHADNPTISVSALARAVGTDRATIRKDLKALGLYRGPA